jgi:hypothetical protein
MKMIVKLFVVVFVFASSLMAQIPSLSIFRYGESGGLPYIGVCFNNGHMGNSYQYQISNDLVNWEPVGGPNGWLTLDGVEPILNLYRVDQPKRFVKALCLASAENLTYTTTCAENDNVSVLFRGDINGFDITATPPTWPITDWELKPDFSNCDTTHVYPTYTFTPYNNKILPDGGLYKDTLWVTRKSEFWRPNGMTVTMDGNTSTKVTDVHYITLVRKHPLYWEWPNFFVLYCDGNMRLIPFSAIPDISYSYGTSVIIGPTEIEWSTDGEEPRPVADILSVDYHQNTKTMLITYRNGGTATLDVNDAGFDHSIVNVGINYPTDVPFCVVRSNWVSNSKCDTSTVVWKDLMDVSHTNSIGFGLSDSLSYTPIPGNEWFFTRPTNSSTTRPSAPDIRITPH